MTIDYDDLILVEERRIHGSLYTSPAVFEDELERIWHRGWVYAAHESELRNTGDYITRPIGREPIVLTRSNDGEVHGLVNRCPHRGNRVVNDPCGNSNNFQCAYHAWTFNNRGALLGVPFPQGYPEGFDKKQHGMVRVPRLGIYRGFIFVSLSGEGISLDEHLGDNGKFLIDRACDVAPDGEIEVKSGALQHRMRCNWKMVFENDTDGYHAQFVHSGLAKAMAGDARGGPKRSNGPRRTKPPRPPRPAETQPRARDLGNGHAELDTHRMVEPSDPRFRWLPGADPSTLDGFVAAVEARLGTDAAHELLVKGPPHATIFPNLFLGQLNIIVLQPLAADETIQITAPMTLKGAPEFDAAILVHSQGGLGPAGLLFTDDDEIAERNQLGLQASAPEWLYLARGVERQAVDGFGPGGSIASDFKDENALWSLWKQYLQVMREVVGA